MTAQDMGPSSPRVGREKRTKDNQGLIEFDFHLQMKFTCSHFNLEEAVSTAPWHYFFASIQH